MSGTANKVITNTGILYFRMFLSVGISLYTTRIVLGVLGALDYGIYNLIMGIVVLLSVLNTAMSISTQRYLAFYQVQRDTRKQKEVFANSMCLHLLLGLLIVLFLKSLGPFLFESFLNIPLERIDAARDVYNFVSITVFFTIITVPYLGALNANENMLYVAIIQIIETLLRFGVALLLYVVVGDKLIFYGMSIAVIGVVIFFIYGIICSRKYEACTLNILGYINRPMLKELVSYIGWNFFGSLDLLIRNQGTSLIFNLFHGPIINASYGIANQVSSQMKFFTGAMYQAVTPQIMKSAGLNDYERLFRLAMVTCKFGFYFLAFLAIPCLFEMKGILSFWLKDVPEYTVSFCSILLISLMLNQLTAGVETAIQAVGKIRFFMLVTGTCKLLVIPISYFMLKSGISPVYVLMLFILVELIMGVLRLLFAKYQIKMSLKKYFKEVLLSTFMISSILILYSWLFVFCFDFDYRFLFTVSSAIFVSAISIYFLGINEYEKKHIHHFWDSLKHKFFKI